MPTRTLLEGMCHLEIPFGSETIAASCFHPRTSSSTYPVILILTPYRKDDFDIFVTGYGSTIAYLVESGYIVVVADLVGTGSSTGFKTEMYSADEGNQGAHLVEWLAEQPWSTGRIGMFGKSYRGKTAFHTAAKNPSSLKAIVSLMGPTCPYDHSQYPAGVQSFMHLGSWLPRMHAFAALPPNQRDSDGSSMNVWNDRLTGLTSSTPWEFQQFDHSTKDKYWQEKDVDLNDVTVPTFIVGGFRDRLQHDPFAQADEIDAPTRVLVGPWRHVSPHQGRETAVDFRKQMVEWFDHFLEGKSTKALDRPPITYWCERGGGGIVDDGTWRSTFSWPTLPSQETLSFALSTDGLVPLHHYDGGGYKEEYEHDHTVGIDSLYYLGQPTDTSADDARSLTAESPPLSHPVEFTGNGEATIRLSSTIEEPLLVVRLVDVSPDGSGSLVTYGVMQTTLRNDLSTSEPLQPGEEYVLTVPLQPRSHIFEADHRIRLAISASFFPWLVPAAEHGRFTIYSSPEDPSFLEFPGTVPDGGSFENEQEMNPPSETKCLPTGHRVFRPRPTVERIRRTNDDSATLRTTKDTTVDLMTSVFRARETVEYTVASKNPSTAVSRTIWNFELERGSEHYEVITMNRVSHTSAYLTTTVKIDGLTVYDHRWKRTPDPT